jgi:hypothetical protein
MVDKNGRLARNIASPNCQEVLLNATYLFGRYEINDWTRAHHESEVILTSSCFNFKLYIVISSYIHCTI